MNDTLRSALWQAAAALVIAASSYQVGYVRATAVAQAARWDAEDEARAAADDLRIRLAQAVRRVDTVRVTVQRLVRRVDTAFLAVPESVYVGTPQVGDARDACLALSSACEQAAALFAIERAVSDSLHRADSVRVVQSTMQAQRFRMVAQREQDKAWRRRAEGVGACVVTGGLLAWGLR